jgi:hypothetical protein
VTAPRPVFITFVNGVDLEVSDKDLRFWTWDGKREKWNEKIFLK